MRNGRAYEAQMIVHGDYYQPSVAPPHGDGDTGCMTTDTRVAYGAHPLRCYAYKPMRL